MTIPVYFTARPSNCCLDDPIAKTEVLLGSTVLATDPPFSGTDRLFNWTQVQAGTYTLTVRATDAVGLTTLSQPITVTVVEDPGPVTAITSPATGASFIAGAAGVTVPLTATATDTADGVAGVSFYNGSTLIGAATQSGGSTAAGATSTWTLNWVGITPGSYTITAQAVDTATGATSSAPVVIAVAADAAPTITLNNPGAGHPPGVPVTLTASAADSDSAVAQVVFYNGASAVAVGTLTSGTASSGVWSGTWRDMSAGTYVLTAQATDDLGIVTTSAPVTVTITEPSSNPQAGVYSIAADHLNTPRLIQNMSQQAVWNWENQEAFGDSVPNENPSSAGVFVFNQRFPGQYNDLETATSYNYFRDYDAGRGGYLQSDLIGLGGGMNTYQYVAGNPLRFIDLKGLAPPNIDGPRVSSPAAPAPPTDVFFPGTQANKDFGDATWGAIQGIQNWLASGSGAGAGSGPTAGAASIPKTDKCKSDEWDVCYIKCGSRAKTKGCYVSQRIKTRLFRPETGGYLQEIERIVNCNCCDQ